VYALNPVNDRSVASYCTTLLTLPAALSADVKQRLLRLVSTMPNNVLHALSEYHCVEAYPADA
jgi:hypothetical protein